MLMQKSQLEKIVDILVKEKFVIVLNKTKTEFKMDV